MTCGAMRFRWRVWSLLALSCAACGGQSSVDFSAFHGIYGVSAHTRNQAACDVEGDAVAGGDAFMVLYTSRYQKRAMVRSCSDFTVCREQAASDGAMVLTTAAFAPEFDRISADQQGLTGTSFGLEYGTQTAHVSQNVLSKTGQDIRIEMRNHVLACVTKGSDCDEAATIAAAASTPCLELRVVGATFAQGL